MIEVQHLSVRYSNGHQAITDINISLSSGSICGLVGPNGSGKSTIFKSLMGLIPISQGHILIDQGSIHLALKKNKIAYVPQSEEIDWSFPVRVQDVVMMGRYGQMNWLRIASKKDKRIVCQALERVNLTELSLRQIGELSGGQKKRVFLARALAQQSKILLLDEPFTGVDLATENSIIELLLTLRKEGYLILISTHNLGSIPEFCDQAILINKQIVAQGQTHNTFTQENLNRAFGGVLRKLSLDGTQLHEDDDPREVVIISDDERPAVFYGNDSKDALKSTKGNSND